MSAVAAEGVTGNAYQGRETPVSGNETGNTSAAIAPRVIRNAYVTLAGFALRHEHGDSWVHCSVCGGKSWFRHCLTCHQQSEEITSKHTGSTYGKTVDHGSCFACGACILPTRRNRWGRVLNRHATYCSSTCRVRAHNYYHQTVEGRAKLAEYERGHAERMRHLEQLAAAFDPTGQNRLVNTARRLGSSCGKCGTDLTPDAPIYLSRRNGRRTPVCRACCTEPEGVTSWGERLWLGPLACDGCARPVYQHRQQPQRHRRVVAGHFERFVVCSERCDQRVMHRGQKARRVAERELVDCAICGERFDHGRRDSRYCSNACRQKAYRARAATPIERLIEATT